jgi:hypothetical protein
MHTVDLRLPLGSRLWGEVSFVLRTFKLVPHHIAMREVLFAERALSTFLGGQHPPIDSAPDQYEGNRAGNGTLNILIHNSFLQGEPIIKRPEKQTEFG